MTHIINYSKNKDFQKWSSIGLSNNYIIPVRDLFPKSVYGNFAKKIDRVAQALMDNNLNFSDLVILNKYISKDGKLVKRASTSNDDKKKLDKISCIINNKEVFKDLVKTSGLLSWIGSASGWLSMIPKVGAVFSGIASAAAFAQGDWVMGIIWLLGIIPAFFGLGFAVKGTQLIIRGVARGVPFLTKLLTSGAKIKLATGTMSMWGKLQKGILALMEKLGLGKYSKKIEKWFIQKEKVLKKSITNAEKNIAKAKATNTAAKGIDGLLKSRRGSEVLLGKVLPLTKKVTLPNGEIKKIIIREPKINVLTLTPLQRSMLHKNLDAMGQMDLKKAIRAAKEGKMRIGGNVTGIGFGTLYAYDVLMRDDDNKKVKEEDDPFGWNPLSSGKSGVGFQGRGAFVEEL